jgi:hypothetical protein
MYAHRLEGDCILGGKILCIYIVLHMTEEIKIRERRMRCGK